MKIRKAFVLIMAATAFGCSTPPATNVNVQTGGGSTTPAASPRQEAINAATPPSVANARTDETAEGTAAQFEGTAGKTEKKNPNAKGSVILADVRSATHGDFDRVVFEFLGGDLASYHIEYIDKPVRSCGSGEVVPFAGDGWLQVRFTGAQAHAPEGGATIKDRSRSPNLPVIKDLKLTCDFEAEVEWVMGVSSPNKYRVLELKSPTRLVIDVKHNRQ